MNASAEINNCIMLRKFRNPCKNMIQCVTKSDFPRTVVFELIGSISRNYSTLPNVNKKSVIATFQIPPLLLYSTCKFGISFARSSFHVDDLLYLYLWHFVQPKILVDI